MKVQETNKNTKKMWEVSYIAADAKAFHNAIATVIQWYFV